MHMNQKGMDECTIFKESGSGREFDVIHVIVPKNSHPITLLKQWQWLMQIGHAGNSLDRSADYSHLASIFRSIFFIHLIHV